MCFSKYELKVSSEYFYKRKTKQMSESDNVDYLLLSCFLCGWG